MPREYEQPNIPGIESEALNPVLIAQIASRLFNDVPEAGSVPRYETDSAGAPSSAAGTLHDKTVLAGETGNHIPLQELPLHPNLPYFADEVPTLPEHDFYFLPGTHEKKPEPLEHHANKLTEQQNYSENTDGSYGLDQFIRRSLPPTPESSERFSEANPENITPFFTILNAGLPADDDFSFRLLYSAAQNQATTSGDYPEGQSAVGSRQSEIPSQSHNTKALSGNQLQEQLPQIPGSTGGPLDGECYAEKLYKTFEQEQGSPNLEAVFQTLRGGQWPVGSQQSAVGSRQWGNSGAPEFPGKAPAPVWPNGSLETPGSSSLPFNLPEVPKEPYYFLREPKAPIHQPEGFDVLTIRKDFPVLHQKIHGKQLVWFDNAATTQKPLSVINAVAQFYANDNSNIHRGAHTLAARATDAYEGAREKIRQFIGAGSASEIIYVRGTTEGVNLVAQTWGRKFIHAWPQYR